MSDGGRSNQTRSIEFARRPGLRTFGGATHCSDFTTAARRSPCATHSCHSLQVICSIPRSLQTNALIMDFAPYQSSPPETSRALSPPRRSATTSPVKHNRRAAPRVPSPSRFARPDHAGEYQDLESNPFPDEDSAVDGRDAGLLGHRPLTGCSTDVYQTSLPFRMEVEAALAYIVIPPAGGIILLIFEHTSDYVR